MLAWQEGVVERPLRGAFGCLATSQQLYLDPPPGREPVRQDHPRGLE